ncbi:MAG: outer membrane protein assembly factor BamA, partial [Bacteroidota bacterium]
MRGYDDGVLSAQGGDPLIAKYTLELRYPISLNPSATFFVTAFAEAGNTFPTVRQFDPFNVKRSAGLGLRVFLPMFGMLGIDYGFGFDKVDSWGTGFGGAGNASVGQKGYTGKLTFTI